MITLFLQTQPELSHLLATGEVQEDEVRPGVHRGKRLQCPLPEDKDLDLPHQQEGGLAHRADGRRQGGAEDDAVLSDHLLATRPQGAHLDQCPRRADEHGRAVATADQLRPRGRRLLVSNFDVVAFFETLVLIVCQLFCLPSSNGKSRAGVYCVANYAMEQVVQHGEVDIFSAVRTVRRHRPAIIENMVCATREVGKFKK